MATAASPSPVRSRAAAGVGPQNKVLGLGETRSPEVFTLGQRVLDGASRGDRPTIERALALGGTLDVKDDIGRGVVTRAAMDSGDAGLVRWLHEKGAPIDEPDTSGRTAVSFAAALGREEIVRYLVEHGAAVDRPDVQKRTPLFHAAADDHADVVRYLHEHGADLNARDLFADTPLIMACSKSATNAAKALLALGADANAKDQEGRSVKERSAPDATVCRNLPS